MRLPKISNKALGSCKRPWFGAVAYIAGSLAVKEFLDSILVSRRVVRRPAPELPKTSRRTWNGKKTTATDAEKVFQNVKSSALGAEDGARCYAFVSDNNCADPTQCPGPWMCCGSSACLLGSRFAKGMMVNGRKMRTSSAWWRRCGLDSRAVLSCRRPPVTSSPCSEVRRHEGRCQSSPRAGGRRLGTLWIDG